MLLARTQAMPLFAVAVYEENILVGKNSDEQKA